MNEPPVRIFCGQAHLGVECPDGKVMCCLCFERVSQDKLNLTEDGTLEDVCKDCARHEREMMKKR